MIELQLCLEYRSNKTDKLTSYLIHAQFDHPTFPFTSHFSTRNSIQTNRTFTAKFQYFLKNFETYTHTEFFPYSNIFHSTTLNSSSNYCYLLWLFMPLPLLVMFSILFSILFMLNEFSLDQNQPSKTVL